MRISDWSSDVCSSDLIGYAVLGIAAAGALLGSDAARQLALTGALVEMVAHGLITGSLFLIAGGFWQRAREYDLEAYGGLAQVAPKLAEIGRASSRDRVCQSG